MKGFVVVTSLLLSSMTALQAQKIEWSSHRGCSIDGPENTVAAFKLAWEKGTDAAECDVRLTKDLKLMVMHDGNAKRTSGQDIEVKNATSDELRKLDVGSFKGPQFKGEKMPYLSEIIETVPKKGKLYIEIKPGKEILPYLKEALESSPKRKQLCLIDFTFETIAEAKRMMPKTECHLLVGGKHKDDWKGLVDKVRDNRIDAVDVDHEIITKEMVDYCHSKKVKVYAWTVDDPDEAKRLIKCGVDGIESNSVPLIKSKMGLKK